MFHLFRSRDKAVRILIGGFLVVVAASMLVYLVPGSGALGGGASSQVVAEVGKDLVTVREVQSAIRNMRRNRQVPAELIGVYAPQMVDQMIHERAMAYEARRLGFRVTDAEVADAIRTMAGGQVTDTASLKQVLDSEGITIPEFEESVRRSLLMGRLQNVALQGVVVTPEEAKREYVRENEKIKLEYIAVSAEDLIPKLKPSDADLKDFFARNRGAFRVPETRDADVIVIDQNKVAETLDTPEAALHQYYNANLDQFRTPERVDVRHILIMTTGKSKDETEALRKKAEDLLKQLKGGADFGELARKNSQDPGSAPKGGDLGWIVRGQTVKNFENVAFTLQPKQLSGVITTEYGFHILEVMAKEDAHLKTFEEAKAGIADTLRKQMVVDRTQSLADQAQVELAKAPGSAAQIAARLNLTSIHAAKLRPTDPVPGLGEGPVSAAIAQLKRNEVSPVLQVSTEKLAVAVVTAIAPPRPAEFAEVQADVRKRYLDQEASRLAAEDGRQAGALLKAGKDLKEIGKTLGMEVKTTDSFARGGAAEGIGPSVYFEDAFSKPVGWLIGPLNVAGKNVVAKLIGKTPADMTQFEAQRQTIVSTITTKRQQRQAALFEDSVVTRLIAEGKLKMYKDVITRLVAGYLQS